MSTTTTTAKSPAKAKTTAQILQGLSKTGPALDATAVEGLLTLVRTDLETEHAAPQAIKAAEADIASAEAALKASRQNGRAVLAKAGEARVNIVRAIHLLTTTDVRGAKSMTGAQVASALEVSTAYVSQSVAAGRALWTLHGASQWSHASYVAVDAARREGADALKALVTTAQAKASAGTDAGTKSSAVVRVSTADVTAARAVVAPTRTETKANATGKTPGTAVRLSAQRDGIDRFLSALTGNGFTGTEEDRTRLLAVIDSYRAAVVALDIPTA